MKLNYISNDNKNLEKKIKYFADYFSFANQFIGRVMDIPFDNPLSLIEKALFQIRNNFENCEKYVTDYLLHLFHDFKTLKGSGNALFITLKAKFNIFNISSEKKTWLRNNQDFIEELENLKTTFKNHLFDDCFSEIHSYIVCDHPLEKHQKAIRAATIILVSLFRLKGHTKESLDTYMGRIISKDKYQFPLPLEILQIETEAEYQKATKDFFETQNFFSQFEGLKNIYIADLHRKAFFFYVIDNCVLDENFDKEFEVSFDKVTFISPLHKKLLKLRKSVRAEDKKNFTKTFPVFFGRQKLLAYVELGYERKDAKKNDGLRIVTEELLNFNQYTGRNFVVTPLHYLAYDSFESEFWTASITFTKNNTRPLSNLEVANAKKNPFEVLRNISSPSKPIILQSEKVFFKAFAREEVEYYWIFIENLLLPVSDKSDTIKKRFSELLLKIIPDLKDDFLFQIGLVFQPFNFNYQYENLTSEEALIAYSQICSNADYEFDLSQYKNKFSSLILREMIDYHADSFTEQTVDKWRVYFNSLLLDLYAYRNALIHTGKTDPYSKIKFSYILPKLINKARWLIINTCVQNSSLSYEALIGTLIK